MPTRFVPLIALIVLVPSSAVDAGVDSGPVAHWTFDEARGAVAHDSSGFRNHGIIVGGAAWTSGVTGGALQLDGIDDYVNCGNASVLNPSSAMTLSVWYRPTQSFSGSGNDPIIDKGYIAHSPPYYQYHLGVTGNLYPSSPASFGFTVSAGVGAGTNSGAWEVGAWYHVVATYDGTRATMYVNGLVVSSFTGVGGSIPDYGKPFLIGKFANLDFYLPGTVDDIQVYDRAIACSEVQYLFLHPGDVTTSPDPVVADLNSDGSVSGADLAILLGSWGTCEACDADVDCNGAVDGGDLAVLLGAWTG